MRKRLHVWCAGLACALVLTVGAQVSYAADVSQAAVSETAETTRAAGKTDAKAYSVKIKFHGNGGKGTMDKITVKSGKSTKLKKNAYKKSGYTFTGWSTSKSGEVVYKDKADVSSLATKANNGTQITLYAQWKLTAPNIKKLTSTPSAITVKYSKNDSIGRYEIQYSTDKKFKETDKKGVRQTFSKTVTDKNITTATLLRVVPDKTYYVRVRCYKKGDTLSSDWSTVKTVKVKKGYTLTNLKAKNAAGIEADVKLSGSGTGYHAKLVMGNATSAVSFGMQFDEHAVSPYTGKTMALIENISSNASGGQTYIRPNNVELQRDKTYHLMMVSNGNGYVDVYVDYKKIGSCYQESMKNLAWFRIEAAGRLNGDKVNVEFSNIKLGCKEDGAANMKVLGDEDLRKLEWEKKDSNPGIKGKFDKKTNTIRFTGTITDLHGDWDSDYERASGIFQFF